MTTATILDGDMDNVLRRVRLSPYRRGMGPTFTLTMYYLGGERLGYRLTQREEGKTLELFSGGDFRPSPLHSIDSDNAVAALLGFLTLRPGDTDEEYFAEYTEAQLEYCRTHAEALSYEADRRFSENR